MDDRARLEDRWKALVNDLLPAAAKGRDWPVHLDHCFGRILLDNASDGVWYDAIRGRPAWAHASDDLLRRAVALGEDVLSGRADLRALNDRSLAWRGKTAG
jgi:hypothetical protein